MKKDTLKSFLTGFGILAVVLSLFPYVAVDYWWIRIFDFPHLQLTFLTLIALLVYMIRFNFKEWRDYAFSIVLIACFLFQFTKILPYTVFGPFEMENATNTAAPGLTLYTSNVYQENTKYEALCEQINTYNADLLLFTETNMPWMQRIKKEVDSNYSHQVEVPLDNTYGMLFYSKLPLFDTHVKYLVSDSIPSIHTKVLLTANDTIQIFAIHPTPPMPQENPMSTDRDAEMMLIAKLALESKYPVIVIGDFNDVAWSRTSILFQQVSRLLDVRKGRGLFNTFNANNPIMRWPLDHIFISAHFKLKHIEKGDDVHSDHFPLFTSLSFEPESKASHQRPYPSEEELESAQKQIDNFYDSLQD
ncbi:endonuclease/exonuclease/phosphatase (EEP) superfamily protein YafD [Ulvibacter sp. MAR_2010_11]|uniref:endonuclease/exonuclease/phosphatase family protein n=1 Tax=Ulvibacter sp. MAR_2010_11 TaxID=1250229 RepID=UPI000C2CA9A7|nr:endonuclease/exonuclease/phosphatase family protein [Ulvibacter sp. MAR_2010_11]PKA84163.1 endonuclease/exonuclease/phosphatase (EEP) superfamily protein YafD [Ulvibacter sp. MAR_2010_11]